MTAPPNDVAISAVSCDRILVSELRELLASRVRGVPETTGDVPLVPKRLSAAECRVAVVLHQRLWGREPDTAADLAVLVARESAARGSVVVIRLDRSALQPELKRMAACDLATTGVDGATDFILDAVRAQGGSPKAARPAVVEAPVPQSRFFEGTPPYLSQGRAFSALRRELDSLSSELGPRLEAEEARCADRLVELHSLPNRVVARVGDVGVSFSWVAGRLGTVADGRLLVIEWNGVDSVARGTAALSAAKPMRETVYKVESDSPDRWHWRSDERHGRASSTADLVDEWMTGATMGLDDHPALR